MKRVFLSYAAADREVMCEIARLLEAKGFDVWYDINGIRTAEIWERSIIKGLSSSDWFLVLLSPHSAVSDWVRAEVRWANAHLRDRVVGIALGSGSLAAPELLRPRSPVVNWSESNSGTTGELLTLLEAVDDPVNDTPGERGDVRSKLPMWLVSGFILLGLILGGTLNAGFVSWHYESDMPTIALAFMLGACFGGLFWTFTVGCIAFEYAGPTNHRVTTIRWAGLAGIASVIAWVFVACLLKLSVLAYILGSIFVFTASTALLIKALNRLKSRTPTNKR